jgi:hypothetical protein
MNPGVRAMQKTIGLLAALLLTTAAASAQTLVITDVSVIDVAGGVARPGLTVVTARLAEHSVERIEMERANASIHDRSDISPERVGSP